ncbi:MAG: glutamine amidotransferase, partial [Gordonia sp. (in: high G+C Gram-positive bacteria)]
MCGIVGLHLRNPELHPRLGELLATMLGEMQGRGADSAGVAVYGNPTWSPPGHGCVSLLSAAATPAEASADLGAALGLPVAAQDVADTLIVSAPVAAAELLAVTRATYPDALIAGFGADLAVLKGVGAPRDLTTEWGLSGASGWQ